MAALLLPALLTACTGSAAVPIGPGSPAPGLATVSPARAPDRVSGWRRDLGRLIPAMDAIHPDLYHGVAKSELERDMKLLEDSVPASNDDQ